MKTNTPVLEESERQPCEVWTRVMGYHRPVSQFNRGKKEEHAERCPFVEPSSMIPHDTPFESFAA